MHKALSISLSGMVFAIEENAYHQLEVYLKQVKSHFSNNPDKEEIISDIENSIASKFTEQLSTAKQVITLENVEDVIKELGMPYDFDDKDDVQKQVVIENQSKKKLFRDEKTGVIGGVCAGLAMYFGIDMVWVRVVAAILLFTPMAGFIIPLYLILWIAMPRAQSTADRIQMQGESVTLDKIESEIKNRFEKNGEENILTKILLLPFRIIGVIFNALKRLGPFVMTFTGIILLIIASMITVGTAVSTGSILFFPHSPYVSSPFTNFPSNVMEYAAVGILYFLVMIPVIALILLAISLIRKKHLFSTPIVIGLVTVWIILLSAGGVIGTGLYPELQNKMRVHMNKEKEFKVGEFKNIDLGGAFDVEIVQGNEYKVVAVGDQFALDQLTVQVENDTLTADRSKPFQICFLCFHRSPKLIITTPSVEDMSFSGATDVYIDSLIQENVKINLTGGSNFEIGMIQVKNLDINSHGASSIELAGETDELNVELSGASGMNALGLRTKKVFANLSGASDAELYVIEELKAKLSGASNLSYEGNPKITSQDISGSSDLEKMGIEEIDEEILELDKPPTPPELE
jgi:phage shock protein PspC (stress-responsive transcriptional regulator)